VLYNSDGAVSELMSPYSYRFIVNYPNEILRHFITNKKDLDLYTMFLGVEFALKDYGSSSIKMNFSDFKKYLVNKLDSNNIALKKQPRYFIKKLIA
jgi:hypothetical protein